MEKYEKSFASLDYFGRSLNLISYDLRFELIEVLPFPFPTSIRNDIYFDLQSDKFHIACEMKT